MRTTVTVVAAVIALMGGVAWATPGGDIYWQTDRKAQPESYGIDSEVLAGTIGRHCPDDPDAPCSVIIDSWTILIPQQQATSFPRGTVTPWIRGLGVACPIEPFAPCGVIYLDKPPTWNWNRAQPFYSLSPDHGSTMARSIPFVPLYPDPPPTEPDDIWL